MHSKLYILTVALLMAAYTVVFVALPRPAYSPLEKRELAHRPRATVRSVVSGAWADSVNLWFADTQPFRDHFITYAMAVKQLFAVKAGGERNITFHAATRDLPGGEQSATVHTDEPDDTLHAYENRITALEKAKVANAGIIIVGTGPRVRALMGFGGGRHGGEAYAEACNTYARAFPQARVYCMVIPTAAAYYLPREAADCSRPQLPTLRHIEEKLDTAVTFVNIYNVLGRHAREPIYLRTDHHWAPLGAYYAARELCRAARVPFRPLSDTSYYERHVVHRFVGTMYAYSKDISVKEAPEDFVYWTPRRARYQTTYTNYDIDARYQPVAEHRPLEAAFFAHYRDGSTGAYCTFMGGDTKIAVVRTDAPNRRRLMILKDSFGNALPGYLFYSFAEIHIIDARYFTRNMRQYVRENQITDIVFANNIFEANAKKKARDFIRFLDMKPVVLPIRK